MSYVKVAEPKSHMPEKNDRGSDTSTQIYTSRSKRQKKNSGKLETLVRIILNLVKRNIWKYQIGFYACFVYFKVDFLYYIQGVPKKRSSAFKFKSWKEY